MTFAAYNWRRSVREHLIKFSTWHSHQTAAQVMCVENGTQEKQCVVYVAYSESASAHRKVMQFHHRPSDYFVRT